jgi:hypothetical protein
MSDHTNEPSRLELYKAGKLDERRNGRPRNAPVAEEAVTNKDSINLSPEVIAISLLVVVLLVITAVAL